MDCKLLLFDLDGTLLRSDKTISEETLEALQNAEVKAVADLMIGSNEEDGIAKFLYDFSNRLIA